MHFCRLQDDAVGIVQSGNMPYRPQYASHAVLSGTPLRRKLLTRELKKARIYSSTAGSAGERHAVASPQEEKVLAMDGRHQQQRDCVCAWHSRENSLHL